MANRNRHPFKLRAISAVLASGLFAATAAWAAPGDPLGPEFTLGLQGDSVSLARNAAGVFVAVSADDQGRIFGQRYATDGTPLGSAFQISQAPTAGASPIASSPAVAIDQGGAFVVVWRESTSASSVYRLKARRYGAAGAAAGAPFAIDDAEDPGVDQGPPAVAMDASGDFYVAWMRGGSAVLLHDIALPLNSKLAFGTNAEQVVARRFSAGGTAQQARIAVSLPRKLNFKVDVDPRPIAGDLLGAAAALGFSDQVGIAADADGDFVVAWGAYSYAGIDTGGYSSLPLPTNVAASTVFARRFGADGRAQGLTTPVASETGAFLKPIVAMDDAGDSMIAWQALDRGGEFIRARRFDASGSPRGQVVDVADSLTSHADLIDPVIAASHDGSAFVFAWNDFFAGGVGFDIQARCLDGSGVPLNAAFLVSPPAEEPLSPAVAADTQGNFVAAWLARPQNQDSLAARQFECR